MHTHRSVLERSEGYADRNRSHGLAALQIAYACKLISGALASRKVHGTSNADDARHLRRPRDGRKERYKVLAWAMKRCIGSYEPKRWPCAAHMW